MCHGVGALAAVYKCTDGVGKLTYSDQPCKSGHVEKVPGFFVQYDTDVSGSVTRNDITRRYVDGFAYWSTFDKELVVLLFPRKVKERELTAVAHGNLKKMPLWEMEGIAKITFFFDEAPATRENLRRVRSVFYGFEGDSARSTWTTNHGSMYLEDRLTHFEMLRDDDRFWWISAENYENMQYIKWKLKFQVKILN